MKQTIYVGTYTRGKRDEGIFICDFDSASGKLRLRGAVGGANDPSFLALAPDRRCLLATNEVSEFDGHAGGGVRSYAVDRETGDLTMLNGTPTHGEHPCHVSFDMTGQWGFVANYSGGSLAVFPVREDGSVGTPTAVVRHHGRSTHEERQTAPHVHSTQVDPSNRTLYVADLGLDQVIGYPLNLTEGRLETGSAAIWRAEPGAGPRHMTFHPNGRFAYVSNELDCTVSVYALGGDLAALQRLSTLPDGFRGENTVADIHLDPTGRYLYVSNRGDDSLAGYAVDADTGLLRRIGFTGVQGRWPRNFGFDVSGAYVLVANQKSNNVVVFRLDAATGTLKATGEEVEVKEPVCVIAAGFA